VVSKDEQIWERVEAEGIVVLPGDRAGLRKGGRGGREGGRGRDVGAGKWEKADSDNRNEKSVCCLFIDSWMCY